MLNDTITGVLALGSFSAESYTDLETAVLYGLTNLTELGASQLVVDVVRWQFVFIIRVLTLCRRTMEVDIFASPT